MRNSPVLNLADIEYAEFGKGERFACEARPGYAGTAKTEFAQACADCAVSAGD